MRIAHDQTTKRTLGLAVNVRLHLRAPCADISVVTFGLTLETEIHMHCLCGCVLDETMTRAVSLLLLSFVYLLVRGQTLT